MVKFSRSVGSQLSGVMRISHRYTVLQAYICALLLLCANGEYDVVVFLMCTAFSLFIAGIL